MALTLPHPLLCGYWGFTPFPWLMILSNRYANHAALIAHEKCHQAQQRRDGWLTFWRRYLFSKDWRYIYELEAYRVWLTVAPTDFWKVVSMMKNYGFTVSEADIISALSKR